MGKLFRFHYTSSYCLTTVTLDDPPALGRYVRYLGANNSYGDASEIELELTTPMATPTNLAVTRSDLTNQFAVLTWANDLTSAWQTAQVQRATTASGPFEAIGSVTRAEDGRFVDETASVGIPYWYRVVYAVTVDDETVAGLPSNVVAYRRCRRLDRSWDDLTHLAEGLTLISVGKPWGGTSNDASKWFDGDETSYGDLDPTSSGREDYVSGGIDFGSANKVGVGFVRLITRNFSPYGYEWTNGSTLYGSDDENWSAAPWNGVQFLTLSGMNSATTWYEFAAADAPMCRYVYFNKKGNNHGALAELEIYGWTLDDIAGAVLPPTDLQLTECVGPMMQVSWTAGVNASSHRVERKVNNGDWTVIADDVAGTSYLDRDVNYTTGRYTYRVTAVNGSSEAMCATTVTKSLWQKGNGTGLHAVYRYPYTIYGDAAEHVVSTCTNASINFNWGTKTLVPGAQEASNNVAVTWSGRLIVPLEGDYEFSTSVDDQMMLRIDDSPVLNVLGGLHYSPAIHLTAGEHALRVDYREDSSSAMIGLYWRGIVDEGGIPYTQFIPEEAPALPEPWEGERTFGNVKFGWTRFTDAATFAIAGQGGDFYQANASGHFVWRRQKGDFDCSFRFTVDASQVNSKVLVVARNANTAMSPIFAGVLQPSLGAIIKYRTPATGGIADMIGWNYSAKTSAGGWLRLERKGNVFNYYYRLNENADWTKVGSYTDANGDFAATQLVGVQVLAGFNNTNNTSLEPSEIAISGFVLKHEMPTMLIIR